MDLSPFISQDFNFLLQSITYLGQYLYQGSDTTVRILVDGNKRRKIASYGHQNLLLMNFYFIICGWPGQVWAGQFCIKYEETLSTYWNVYLAKKNF